MKEEKEIVHAECVLCWSATIEQACWGGLISPTRCVSSFLASCRNLVEIRQAKDQGSLCAQAIVCKLERSTDEIIAVVVLGLRSRMSLHTSE
jgi:L-2-hydroxyglutarate oxidase LhgO